VLEDHAQPGRALEYLRRLVGVVRVGARKSGGLRVRIVLGQGKDRARIGLG